MARRLYRTRTPARSTFRLAPWLGAPLRHSSGPPSNHFRAVAPSWHYFYFKRHEDFCQVSPVFNTLPTSLWYQLFISCPLWPRQSLTARYTVVISLPPRLLWLCVWSHDPRGPFEAKVNMGPVEPPQRKDRLPRYTRNKLVDLQNKFDESEKLRVFKWPEDINVSVEYLYPSFLVKKGNGGYRLVTVFADVGRYSKHQPSLTPDVDYTLRQSLSGGTSLLLISRLPFIKSLSHASRRNTAAYRGPKALVSRLCSNSSG